MSLLAILTIILMVFLSVNEPFLLSSYGIKGKREDRGFGPSSHSLGDTFNDNVNLTFETVMDDDGRQGDIGTNGGHVIIIENKPCDGAPNMSVALSCLRLTTPNLTFTYPDDPFEHFLQIHATMRPWIERFPPRCWPKDESKGRFCGPWLENHWVKHFEHLLELSGKETCLTETFGPFIPLLVPWSDIRRQGGYQEDYPEKFILDLMSVLRSDLPYITVADSDAGVNLSEVDNILVFSGGGVGHVPVPLFKQTEDFVPHKIDKRKWLLNYVGTLREGLRQDMHDYLTREVKASYKYYHGNFWQGHWRDIMLDSYTSLVPRGCGRSAFHLMETLQLGLIPVFIYNDVPWVPYLNLFIEKFGFVVTVDELPFLVQKLQNMTVIDFLQREEEIASHRASHFSHAGVMDQITRFMLFGRGDLQCVRNPGHYDRLGRRSRSTSTVFP